LPAKSGANEVAQGDLPAALTSYEASLAIRERLAKSDPGNALWRRGLSISYERVGDVQVAQGNLPAALTSYEAYLAIAERLAKSDPGNAKASTCSIAAAKASGETCKVGLIQEIRGISGSLPRH
jgi:tetratricopeptide (TPR) repeat protein